MLVVADHAAAHHQARTARREDRAGVVVLDEGVSDSRGNLLTNADTRTVVAADRTVFDLHIRGKVHGDATLSAGQREPAQSQVLVAVWRVETAHDRERRIGRLDPRAGGGAADVHVRSRDVHVLGAHTKHIDGDVQRDETGGGSYEYTKWMPHANPEPWFWGV